MSGAAEAAPGCSAAQSIIIFMVAAVISVVLILRLFGLFGQALPGFIGAFPGIAGTGAGAFPNVIGKLQRLVPGTPGRFTRLCGGFMLLFPGFTALVAGRLQGGLRLAPRFFGKLLCTRPNAFVSGLLIGFSTAADQVLNLLAGLFTVLFGFGVGFSGLFTGLLQALGGPVKRIADLLRFIWLAGDQKQQIGRASCRD